MKECRNRPENGKCDMFVLYCAIWIVPEHEPFNCKEKHERNRNYKDREKLKNEFRAWINQFLRDELTDKK